MTVMVSPTHHVEIASPRGFRIPGFAHLMSQWRFFPDSFVGCVHLIW